MVPIAYQYTPDCLSTVAGDGYPLSELTAMCNEAVFGGVTAHPIPLSPHTVVMGRA